MGRVVAKPRMVVRRPPLGLLVAMGPVWATLQEGPSSRAGVAHKPSEAKKAPPILAEVIAPGPATRKGRPVLTQVITDGPANAPTPRGGGVVRKKGDGVPGA